MGRFVYIASTFSDESGRWELGIFGTLRRARAALRAHGYEPRTAERSEWREHWYRPEDRRVPYPNESGLIERRVVE